MDLVMDRLILSPWLYMAQARKGGLIQSLFKPIHGNGAIYFYPGVSKMT